MVAHLNDSQIPTRRVAVMAVGEEQRSAPKCTLQICNGAWGLDLPIFVETAESIGNPQICWSLQLHVRLKISRWIVTPEPQRPGIMCLVGKAAAHRLHPGGNRFLMGQNPAALAFEQAHDPHPCHLHRISRKPEALSIREQRSFIRKCPITGEYARHLLAGNRIALRTGGAVAR